MFQFCESFPVTVNKRKNTNHFPSNSVCPQIRSGTGHSVTLDSSLGFVSPFIRTVDSWSQKRVSFFSREMFEEAEKASAHPLRTVA